MEVDLIESPAAESPATITFVGAVKWQERIPFDRSDVLRRAERRWT